METDLLDGNGLTFVVEDVTSYVARRSVGVVLLDALTSTKQPHVLQSCTHC